MSEEAATASATGPRPSDLPELPVLGHQHRWNVAKIVLRSISLASAVLVICLLISFGFAGRRYTSVYPSFGITVVVIAWDAAEFIVICVRRNKGCGIKAGAHVGMDLVLWLGAIATLAFEAILMDIRSGLNYQGIYTGTWPDMPWYGLDVVHLAFLGVLIILHFILFVRACVEVDRRNKDRRVQELILAMQKHGHHPQDFSLATFAGGRLQPPPPPQRPRPGSSADASPTLAARSEASGDRDFSTKYNQVVAAPVPELLESAQRLEMDAAGHPSELPADSAYPDEMPVHPEEMRNQKVLAGAFPR